MKRQRSVEWQQEKDYSSSEEENDRIGGRVNSEANMSGSNILHRKNNTSTSPSRDSASVLAQLIAQTQQLSSSKSRSRLGSISIKVFIPTPINNVIKTLRTHADLFVCVLCLVSCPRLRVHLSMDSKASLPLLARKQWKENFCHSRRYNFN
jgi:hypothetical protein